MTGIWITPEILELKRTPAETQLLARICYRAAITADGKCRDSNRELAQATNIHFQTVSDLVKKLDKDGLCLSKVLPEKANERTLSPISKILTAYKENADRYKAKADSTDYKEIPDSTPESPKALYVNSLYPMSETLIAYKQITYSLYKDIKLLKTFENSLKGRVRFEFVSGPKKIEKKPPPSGAPPAPSRPATGGYKARSIFSQTRLRSLQRTILDLVDSVRIRRGRISINTSSTVGATLRRRTHNGTTAHNRIRQGHCQTLAKNAYQLSRSENFQRRNHRPQWHFNRPQA